MFKGVLHELGIGCAYSLTRRLGIVSRRGEAVAYSAGGDGVAVDITYLLAPPSILPMLLAHKGGLA
jgi:hypothetical protein